MSPLSVKPYHPMGFLVLLLLELLCFVSGCYGHENSTSSAYDVLQSYGFPAGLLPETVTEYTLEDSGEFALNLSGSCAVDIPDAYPVKYAAEISGSINQNKLSNLRGITVKVFYMWWSIDTISVSGDDLIFEVGIASASYPILNFNESPVCEENAHILLPTQAS